MLHGESINKLLSFPIIVSYFLVHSDWHDALLNVFSALFYLRETVANYCRECRSVISDLFLSNYCTSQTIGKISAIFIQYFSDDI